MTRKPDQYIINALSTNPVFNDLNLSMINKLTAICKIESLDSDRYLMRLGDPSVAMFMVLEGELEVVLAENEAGRRESLSVSLKPGDVVGEIGLFDRKPRSADVKALTSVKVIRIPYDKFEELIEQYPDLYPLYLKIIKTVTARIRGTNRKVLFEYEQNERLYQQRFQAGSLIIGIVSVMSLFILLLNVLDQLKGSVSTVSIVTSLFLLLVVVISLFVYVANKQPLSFYGVTTNRLKDSLFYAIKYSCLSMLFIILIKYFLIQYYDAYQNLSLFGVFDGGVNLVEGLTFFLYTINIVTQEFVVRGIIQGSLQVFFMGPRRYILAVLVSNLIFMAVHVYISFPLAFFAFGFGLFWGWLYVRKRNLWAVIVSHMMIGIFALDIIQFPGILI